MFLGLGTLGRFLAPLATSRRVVTLHPQRLVSDADNNQLQTWSSSPLFLLPVAPRRFPPPLGFKVRQRKLNSISEVVLRGSRLPALVPGHIQVGSGKNEGVGQKNPNEVIH